MNWNHILPGYAVNPMNSNHVLLVGTELFTTGIISLLSSRSTVMIVGRVSTVDDAWLILKSERVDTVIIAESDEPDMCSICPLLTSIPNVNIIKTHLDSAWMDVITQRQIDASTAGLLATLAALPPSPGSGANYH
jgi:DNA-binding NarL/FixJ family response regulator